ncbi:MAG: transglutaminase domain-containing protein [Planctomycetes bacterium]|nr:transglutaminase domain-containing protein [Planctomycetota bacterium]
MFERERGRNQTALIEDPLTRRGVELWLERVLGFYGEQGGVDIEVIDGQIILNARTKDYLYGDFTPRAIPYVAGSRPLLEAVVRECVRPGTTQREQALALMRRVRDNRDRGLASPNLFYGGTEEELLKRGAIMCNEVSRLFACLCQIAGMPARLHGAHISGHMMTEVLMDGSWGWIDPMKGMAPVTDANQPASVWDLMQEPKLFERQPAGFWDDVRPVAVAFGTEERDPRNLALAMASFRDFYFHPREAQALGNYFAWDSARYTYPWIIRPADATRLGEARHQEALNRQKLGWPAFYHNAQLFDEPLRMRGDQRARG